MTASNPSPETNPITQPRRDHADFGRVFEVLLENFDDGVLVFDTQRDVIFMNRAAERLMARTREEIYALPQTCGEVMGCHDMYGRSLANEKNCPVFQILEHQRPEAREREMIIKNRNGVEIWVQGRYFPVFDDSGRVAQVIAILHDISERRAMEEQLIESRKLAAFGILTAGIAHELKTPLAILRSAAEIVAKSSTSDDQRREAAEFIMTETMRLDRTIRQFLAYARPNPPVLAQNDLNEMVEHSVDMFLATDDRASRMRIEKRLAPDLPNGWFDQVQMHQVLLNLLMNAEEAVEPEGGLIAVSTALDHDHLVLTIEDGGPGIDPTQIERVFDPFFTTKPEGAGLGLAVVRRIITEHRGRMKIERSRLGGAAVLIRLPTHPAERPIPVEFDTSVLPLGAAIQVALRRRNSQERPNDV